MRWIRIGRWLCTRLLMSLLVSAALASAVLAVSSAPTARASGRGPCTPITAHDLAQPQVTPRGHAWAKPSRTQGTGGTLLSISGGAWPANASVVVEGWSDNSGQLLPDGIVTQAKATANGALQTPPFRVDMGCEWLGWINSTIKPVTLLFVAHTLDGSFQTVSNRQPMLFTFLPSPLFNGAKPGETKLAATHPGDLALMTSSGWTPGDRITITTLVTTWPNPAPNSIMPPSVTALFNQDTMTVTTGSSGAFTLPYHLPDAPPLSNVLILLHTNDARLGDVSIYPFSPVMLISPILPTVQLAERTQLAGGVLTVTGDHWLSNQQVDIEYCRGLTRDPTNSLYCNQYAAEPLGVVMTDSTGHFFAQVHLPIQARPGDVTVQARISGADLWKIQDSRPFAAGQPLTIVAPAVTLTYAQQHPRLTRLLAAAPYLGGSAIALLALLVAALILIRRRRQEQPAV